MTDLAKALKTADTMTPFGHRDVREAKVEIPGAAGGLRDAMKFDPIELDIDDEVTVVMRCKVSKVRFQAIGDTELLTRIHVLVPLEDQAAFVEDDAIDEIIAKSADKVRKQREIAKGVHELPFDGDDVTKGHDPDDYRPVHEQAGIHALPDPDEDGGDDEDDNE